VASPFTAIMSNRWTLLISTSMLKAGASDGVPALISGHVLEPWCPAEPVGVRSQVAHRQCEHLGAESMLGWS
jgi:hypothetical protein